MSYIGYKSQPLDFMIYKDGPQGKSIESSTRYYALTIDKPAAPQEKHYPDAEFTENGVAWSKAPKAYTDEDKTAGKQYYESVITIYDNDSYTWSEPVKQTVLDIEFIKSIAITTDQLYAVEAKVNNLRVTDENDNIIFKADGRAIDKTDSGNGPNSDDDRVKIGGFIVTDKYLVNNSKLIGDYGGDSETNSSSVGFSAPKKSEVSNTDLAIWAGYQTGDGSAEKPFGFDASFKVDYSGHLNSKTGEIGNFKFNNATMSDMSPWNLTYAPNGGRVILCEPNPDKAILDSNGTLHQVYEIMAINGYKASLNKVEIDYDSQNRKQLSLTSIARSGTKSVSFDSSTPIRTLSQLPIDKQALLRVTDLDLHAITSDTWSGSETNSSTIINPTGISTPKITAPQLYTKNIYDTSGNQVLGISKTTSESTYDFKVTFTVKNNDTEHATVTFAVLKDNNKVTSATLSQAKISITSVVAHIQKYKSDGTIKDEGEEKQLTQYTDTAGGVSWKYTLKDRFGWWRLANWATITVNYSVNGAADTATYELGKKGNNDTFSKTYTDSAKIIFGGSSHYQVFPAKKPNIGTDSGVSLGKDSYEFLTFHVKDIYCDGTCNGSSIKIKNSIKLIEADNRYTTLFNNLKPVTFKYNNGTSNRTHMGFIAQEVYDALIDAKFTTQDIAAYVAKDNGNGEVIGLRYSEFIALNTNEIQKLKKRVSEQEKVIKILESRLKGLEEKLKE